MGFSKAKFKNGIFLVVILLMIIPQTRQPIQVFLNKGLALFGPSVVAIEAQKQVEDYEWQLEATTGVQLSFKDLEGKVVLVNFWATWCPPCIAEMGSLQDLYKSYKDKVAFVFVSHEDKAVIQKFIEAKGYTFPVFKPSTSAPKAFNVKSIPRTFLIDAQGHIVIDKTGAANWNSTTVKQTLDTLLAAKH